MQEVNDNMIAEQKKELIEEDLNLTETCKIILKKMGIPCTHPKAGELAIAHLNGLYDKEKKLGCVKRVLTELV